jgi:hypothetical protein
MRRPAAASQLAPTPGQLIFLNPPGAFSVVSLSLPVGISTRTADGFQAYLKRPQTKIREFSNIAGYFHLPVLALRMHQGYT